MWPSSVFNIVSKAETIAVAVFDIEVAVAVGLVADVADDLYSFASEFFDQ
jgi:hypothetical protein